MRFTVDRLDHIVLNVVDVEMAASWYQRVLGMEREEFGDEQRTALKFGGQKLNLRPVGPTPAHGSRPRTVSPAAPISASSPRSDATT